MVPSKDQYSCQIAAEWKRTITSNASTARRLKPVASANKVSDPFGTGTSLIGGWDSGFVNALRDELHDATRVGRCEIKRGGSTSARHTNTIEMGRKGVG